MKKLVMIFSCVLTIFSAYQSVAQESVETIVKKMEENRVFDIGLYSEGKIIIKDRFGERTTEFISMSKGERYSLLEYTSAAEKGQKTLRVGDKLYLYFPDAEEVITLNRSMFQQSMLDSDISYEDIAGDKSVLDKFSVSLEGEEEKDNVECYVLYFSAKNDRKESYPYQRLWVRKDNYVVQYAENYTRRKKLRKTLRSLEISTLKNGVQVISDMVIKDVLKKGDGTRIQIQNIELRDIDDSQFSIEALRF